MFFAHVPKTGGTQLRYDAPIVMGQRHCNKVYNIPPCCAYPKYTMLVFAHLNGSTTDCGFLDYEIRPLQLESFIQDFPRFKISSSFRQPLAHYFSARFHLTRKVLKNPKFKESDLEYLMDMESDSHNLTLMDANGRLTALYDLRNFQLCRLVNCTGHNGGIDSLAKGLQVMRSLYWFNILEHYRLSLILLQCTVNGKTNDTLLGWVLGPADQNPYNNTGTPIVSKLRNSAQVELAKIKGSDPKYHLLKLSVSAMAKITQEIELDTVLYNAALAEFFHRVKIHLPCIRTSGYYKHELVAHELINT